MRLYGLFSILCLASHCLYKPLLQSLWDNLRLYLFLFCCKQLKMRERGKGGRGEMESGVLLLKATHFPVLFSLFPS